MGILLHVHDDHNKESNRESKRALKIKNRITMCKAPCMRPIKQGLNQLEFQLIKRSLNILKSEIEPSES